MRLRKQLSLFVENEPGVLATVCEELQRSEINILAMTVGDMSDYAVVRMVVDKPDEAVHILGEAGMLVLENEVVVMSLQNRIGALGEVAGKLGDAGINIDYAYCTVEEAQPEGTLVLRTAQPGRALEILS